MVIGLFATIYIAMGFITSGLLFKEYQTPLVVRDKLALMLILIAVTIVWPWLLYEYVKLRRENEYD